MEADVDIRVGYQDIIVLAKFYGVSTDVLFGLTDNDEKHRVYEIDQLRLTDAALDVLKDGKLNNRLISEFLSHADLPQLLSAMEIYIDRKVLPQMACRIPNEQRITAFSHYLLPPLRLQQRL